MNLLTVRQLCERQDPHGQRVLREAAEDAARNGLAAVGVEIALLTLLRDRAASAGLRRILAAAGIATEPMESALRLSLQGQPRGRPGALPAFGEALESVLRAATLLALDAYRETAVTPVRWIEAILRRRDQWSGLLGRLPGLDRLGPAAPTPRPPPESRRRTRAGRSGRDSRAGPTTSSRERRAAGSIPWSASRAR